MQPQITSLPKGTVSPGSACTIAAVPEEWVASIPEPDPATGRILFDITLKAGFSWLAVTLVARARPFREESARDEAGASWNQSITGRPYGQSEDLQLALQHWCHHRWVILYQEAGTGIVYLVGAPGSGALLNLQYGNEKGTITAVSFTRKAVKRAAIYQGIF